METKIIKSEKLPVIIVYALLFIVAAAIYIIMVFPVEPGRIGNYTCAVVFSFGIFIILTGVQAVISRFFDGRGIKNLTYFTVIKAVIVFFIELALDWRNINFIRTHYYVQSILIISFLVLIIIAAAAEITSIRKTMKRTGKESDKDQASV